MTRSSKAALAKSVKAFILANMGEGKLFPPIDDGNMGVCAYIASDSNGGAMLELAKDLYPGAPLAQSFVYDFKKHVVFAVMTSEDEPALHLVVFDPDSGDFTPITDLGVIDLTSSSPEVFARCFPGFSQEDDDWGVLVTELITDGRYLNLGEGGARDLWWE